MVSGSFSLRSRGSFHRSFTVLCAIGHWVVFSLAGWSPRLPTGFPVSRGTLVPACCLRDFGYGAFTFSGRPSRAVPLSFVSRVQVRNPGMLACRFGLFPVRSPLLGKSMLSFFSSGYLDVSVPRVPSSRLWIGLDAAGVFRLGSPIQRSSDRWISAPPRRFSQLIASFFGSQCLGILHMLFSAWPVRRGLPCSSSSVAFFWPGSCSCGSFTVLPFLPLRLVYLILFCVRFSRSSVRCFFLSSVLDPSGPSFGAFRLFGLGLPVRCRVPAGQWR